MREQAAVAATLHFMLGQAGFRGPPVRGLAGAFARRRFDIHQVYTLMTTKQQSKQQGGAAVTSTVAWSLPRFESTAASSSAPRPGTPAPARQAHPIDTLSTNRGICACGNACFKRQGCTNIRHTNRLHGSHIRAPPEHASHVHSRHGGHATTPSSQPMMRIH